MEAIVLAGGLGSRLKEVVADVPKPMAPVAGRPFLEYLLVSLSSKGVERVILSVGYMAEKIVKHFGNSFEDMQLVYEVEKTPLGTGGAIKSALKIVEGDHVFVFNGDTFLDLEIPQVEAHWQAHRVPLIVAREVPDTTRYGRIIIHQGRVRGFAVKSVGGPGLINAGCYVFPCDLLDKWSIGCPFSIESDFLQPYICDCRFDAFITTAHFIDIGIPEDYSRAQIEFSRWTP